MCTFWGWMILCDIWSIDFPSFFRCSAQWFNALSLLLLTNIWTMTKGPIKQEIRLTFLSRTVMKRNLWRGATPAPAWRGPAQSFCSRASNRWKPLWAEQKQRDLRHNYRELSHTAQRHHLMAASTTEASNCWIKPKLRSKKSFKLFLKLWIRITNQNSCVRQDTKSQITLQLKILIGLT